MTNTDKIDSIVKPLWDFAIDFDNRLLASVSEGNREWMVVPQGDA